MEPAAVTETVRRPEARHLGLILVSFWAGLLAVQVPLLTEGRPLNLAPSDLVLAVAAVILLPTLQMRRGTWSVWLFALPITMALNVVTIGALSRYSLLNKLIGIVVLLTGHLVITSVVRSWQDAAAVIRAFLFGVAGVNLIALTLFILRTEIPLLGCATCVRYHAFMPDPNLAGSLLALAILAIVLGHGRQLQMLPSRGTWILLGSLSLGLVLTLSRSAWLTLASGLAALLISQGLRRSFKAVAAIGVVGGVLAIAVFTFSSDADELVVTAARTGTIESRGELAVLAIDASFENPLIGIGLGVFPERHGQIIHNSGLWLTTELGVVGLIVLVGLTGWVVQRLFIAYRFGPEERRPMVSFLIAANIGMFVFAQIVDAIYQRHWWLIISLSAVAAELAIQDLKSQQPAALAP